MLKSMLTEAFRSFGAALDPNSCEKKKKKNFSASLDGNISSLLHDKIEWAKKKKKEALDCSTIRNINIPYILVWEETHTERERAREMVFSFPLEFKDLMIYCAFVFFSFCKSA